MSVIVIILEDCDLILMMIVFNDVCRKFFVRMFVCSVTTAQQLEPPDKKAKVSVSFVKFP